MMRQSSDVMYKILPTNEDQHKAKSKHSSLNLFCCLPKCFMSALSRPLTVISCLGVYLIVALAFCHIAERSGVFKYSIKRLLPSLYQHYLSGGIVEGLKAPRSGFTLNRRPITIYSGAIHYFRVHPHYWKDRLRKARAAGLNAVETYVPWNLHEPRMGEFDFGEGGNDLSLLLDVRRFVQMAQEEDLFVIFRPGPYICSEWEFGGMPSWLLRDKKMKVRTSDQSFLKYVHRYFNELLPRIANLTFTRGGPIIAIQIENEYGSFGTRKQKRDKAYLSAIRDLYRKNGINELYFTSDSPASSNSLGALPGVLQTANFAGRADRHFEALLQNQPDRALMVMEFWSGWFDHWMQPIHETGNPPFVFAAVLTSVFSYNASVNFYMFAGGSTFAFMNGANVKPQFPVYQPDVSSYDYDALVSEAGDYNEKYRIAKALIASNNPVRTRLPPLPEQTVKTAYGTVQVTEYIPIQDLFDQVPEEDHSKVKEINFYSSMENLPINDGNGQSYGIVVYRKKFKAGASSCTLRIKGRVRDIAMVLIDGEQRTTAPTSEESLKHFGYWGAKNASLVLTGLTEGEEYILDIMVENMGRVNFGIPAIFNQKKGLWEGPVYLDEEVITDWEVISLQLKGSWVKNLTGWKSAPDIDETINKIIGPAMFRARFTLNEPPTDTFLDMGQWSKGCIFVNGFPLGRHFYLGPQVTSFIPAPLLKQGENEIVIFEHYAPASQIILSNIPNLGPPRRLTSDMAFYL